MSRARPADLPAPLIPFALAAMVGVLLGRSPLLAWLGGPAGLLALGLLNLLVAWFALPERFRRRGLLGVILLAYAAWAGLEVERNRDSPVGALAESGRRLVRLRGTLLSESRIQRPSANPFTIPSRQREATRLTLWTESIAGTKGWQPISGAITVRISGILTPSLPTGTRIEMFGWLDRPSGPSNEGEFDYAAYLADQGIRATLSIETPAAVTLLADAPGWSPAALRDRFRFWARATLEQQLGEPNAAIVLAVLLGDRSSLSNEEVDSFFETGTLHLLVVSGLHVMLVVGLVWQALALCVESTRIRAAIALAIVLLYAYLTGGNPPVVRAVVLMGLWLVGFLLNRPTSPLNSLAAGVLLLLAQSPASLMRTGPQLSFLAVLAILLFVTRFSTLAHARDQARERRYQLTGFESIRWGMVDLVLCSMIIWITTAPLLASRFHIVTPVGVLLSVLLLPLATLVMAAGAVLLVLSAGAWLAAPVVQVLLIPLVNAIQVFVAGMRGLLDIGRGVPIGFSYVAGLPTWWILGWYVVLLLPWLVWRRHAARIFAPMALTWMLVAGSLILFSHPATKQPTFHQLSVGHGSCSILEGSRGSCFLFDCGSIDIPQVGRRVIAPWLWTRGIERIDAIFISHGDLDHYSGLVELVDRFPVRKIYVPHAMLDPPEPAVRLLQQELAKRGYAFEPVAAGDRIVGDDAWVSVLHPPDGSQWASDNEGSLVLQIETESARILLLGDLERAGLDRLLDGEPRACDILLAPHHGARGSNPSELALWALPRLVLVSQSHRVANYWLDTVYGEVGAEVLRTGELGQISCQLEGDTLRIWTFREGQLGDLANDRLHRLALGEEPTKGP